MAKKTRTKRAVAISESERVARAERMRQTNLDRPKLTPDDYALVAFLRDNRDVLDAVVSSYREHMAQVERETLDAEGEHSRVVVSVPDIKTPWDKCVACCGIGCTFCAGIHAPAAPVTLASSDDINGDDFDPFATQVQTPIVPEPEPITARRGFTDLGRGGFICLDCGATFTASPDSCPSCDAPPAETPSPETRPVLDTCSVCLSPIYDLDEPCTTCAQAGRANNTPESLHAAQARNASPGSTAQTVHDVPRLSNSVTRAPIPAPAPPLRAYSHTEACISCGRLPELHESHGGPIGHAYSAPPPATP